METLPLEAAAESCRRPRHIISLFAIANGDMVHVTTVGAGIAVRCT
jgi:hypothetical protein